MPVFKPRTFAYLKRPREEKESLVFIVRVEGRDIYYWPIRGDGLLGREDVIHDSTGLLRVAPKGAASLVVVRNDLDANCDKLLWEVSLPDPEHPGEFREYSDPLPSRLAALRIAQ